MAAEQRDKIRRATLARWERGEPNPMTGRKRYDLRLKLPVRYLGAGNPFHGRRHSDETRDKLRLAQFGQHGAALANGEIVDSRFRGDRNRMQQELTNG